MLTLTRTSQKKTRQNDYTWCIFTYITARNFAWICEPNPYMAARKLVAHVHLPKHIYQQKTSKINTRTHLVLYTFASQAVQRAASSAAQNRVAAAVSQESQSILIKTDGFYPPHSLPPTTKPIKKIKTLRSISKTHLVKFTKNT